MDKPPADFVIVNFRIRSHLASEYMDKPQADFVIINLKMAGRLLNPHSQDASEFRSRQSLKIVLGWCPHQPNNKCIGEDTNHGSQDLTGFNNMSGLTAPTEYK